MIYNLLGFFSVNAEQEGKSLNRWICEALDREMG